MKYCAGVGKCIVAFVVLMVKWRCCGVGNGTGGGYDIDTDGEVTV